MNKMGVCFILHVVYLLFYFLSSPFLFVYGDDRVIRYTGVDVETGGAENVQPTECGLVMGIRARDFLLCIYYVLLCT